VTFRSRKTLEPFNVDASAALDSCMRIYVRSMVWYLYTLVYIYINEMCARTYIIIVVLKLNSAYIDVISMLNELYIYWSFNCITNNSRN